MKIGVISDTHLQKSKMVRGINVLKEENIEVLFHLGDNTDDVNFIKTLIDVPIYNVKGNCDFITKAKEEEIRIVGGKKFFLTHGDRYDVKYNYTRLIYRAMELKVDFAVFGHTHIATIFSEEGITFMNPGSTSLPRGGYPSVGVIEVDGESIKPKLIEIK